jgi:hypothetical protein
MGPATLSRVEHPGIAKMLISDTYITFCLLKEALRRIAGVPTDASLLAVMVCWRTHSATSQRGCSEYRPAHPSFADTMSAVAMQREALRGIVGVQARDTPFVATLIAIGLLAPAFRLVASALRLIAVTARRLRPASAAYGREWW